jgi:putative aldouronate transport system permease protein
VGTVFNVLINSLYAYPLSRRDFPFKKLFSNYILITLLFSGGLAPTYYIYVRILGIKNSLLAMILPGLAGGFNIFITRTFYQQNIPFEIIESAKIDGASESKTFFSIVLPLSKPIIATIALFSTVYYWNDFYHCMIYIDKEELYNLQFSMQRALMTIQYLRNNIEAMNQGAALEINIPSETVRMAMVVVGIGPIVFAYPFFQKYFIKGLTVGSVKG